MNSTQTRQKTLPVLIKEADEVFSTFIRLRDSNGGMVDCFICGYRNPWKQSQNMHFIDRDQMPTRYDEINCHAGCEYCNCYDPQHSVRYAEKMSQTYSEKTIYALELKSRGLQKYMRFELEELIEKYSLLVKELKAKK